MRQRLAVVGLLLLAAGCNAIPDVVHEPQYHNPFPQLSRVAVLPFYNLSADPTVDQDQIALAYYNELQKIPGFEVMPVGVAKQLAAASGIEGQTPRDFQKLAQALGVDAVLVGAVTEFSPYYPPRMGLAVNWYAANPCFHEIPPGYGLPWGTSQEEYIPESLVFEAEFALAREQLKTQTPAAPAPAAHQKSPSGAAPASGVFPAPVGDRAACEQCGATPESSPESAGGGELGGALPPDWPDPRGFIPRPPSPVRPPCRPYYGPVISHVAIYNGHDEEFTAKLANYFYFRDDARFGGWQAYLQRSDDFIRFCCYLHLTETLAARGGAGETRVVWRWPIGRYER